LHKEDKASADSSSLSLSLSSGNQGGTSSSTDAKNKDASFPLLHLGTVRLTAPLSRKAEPKSDAAVEWDNCQSLTKDEKATAYKEAKDANPGVVGEDFVVAYRNALLKAGIEKWGTNHGGSLGQVDLSILSGIDVEDDAGEDSASSEDGMNAIRKDLERQKQVSPPTSPKENRYLTGFMRSSDKQQAVAQAKQALDEDSISLPSSFKQAGNGSSAEKQGQRTGDVTGHGGSMSVQQ
jgi:hypothetical protein